MAVAGWTDALPTGTTVQRLPKAVRWNEWMGVTAFTSNDRRSFVPGWMQGQRLRGSEY